MSGFGHQESVVWLVRTDDKISAVLTRSLSRFPMAMIGSESSGLGEEAEGGPPQSRTSSMKQDPTLPLSAVSLRERAIHRLSGQSIPDVTQMSSGELQESAGPTNC